MDSTRQEDISELLTEIHEAIDRSDNDFIVARLKALHAADIAHILESLPKNDRTLVFNLLDSEKDGAVLAEVSEGVRPSLVKEMDSQELRQAAESMDVDDLADFVGDLPEARAKDLLEAMADEDREAVEEALSYPEESAGGLMEPVAVTLQPDYTVDTVLRYARRIGLPKRTDKLFVVDRNGVLKGSVRLAHIMASPENSTVASIMSTRPRTVPVDMSQEDVARLFEKYDMLSAAVVDRNGRLLGRITVDDVVDIIRDQGEQHMMSMAGLPEDEDLFAPVLRTARGRSIWLGVNLVTAFLAAGVVGLFQGTIKEIVALAVLMPIVAGMGGNAGTQTLTVVIRALALGQISSANKLDLLRKELLVGLVNGILFAVVVGGVAFFWFESWKIGAVIAAAMCVNLLNAAFFGGVIPLLLKRFGVDPPVASGILLTTATDVIGFLTFLGLATLFILRN